jgi:hypothetical protein
VQVLAKSCRLKELAAALPGAVEATELVEAARTR